MKEINLIKKIEVVPYDANWPTIFEAEKKIISAALGDDNCAAIYHIGSTAVPELAAKPKIDIIAVGRDREMAINDLEKVGYVHKGEWNIPLKCGFTKRGAADVNLHVFFDENHPEIELNLKFRDYLRSHPDVRDEYAAIKMKILEDEDAHQKSDKSPFPIYTIRKRAFIDNIIKNTGFNRLRVLKCTTEDEWNAAKKIREKYSPQIMDATESNHEHFVLYRGIEIIGYADILIISKSKAEISILSVFENSDQESASYFLNVIKEWAKVHALACSMNMCPGSKTYETGLNRRKDLQDTH
ncbi:MAG: GrpB family protein [Holosporaceae bacterium]|jgi:GrpB-like predicted nucleotidyltransferase (UPF0157 family)|nr:GrpB family protein [Holosporaceae bacterium]